MHNLIITPMLNEFIKSSPLNGDYIIIMPYSTYKTFKGVFFLKPQMLCRKLLEAST